MSAGDEPPDKEFDVFLVDEMETGPLPVRLRPENPEYKEAWRFFYGYKHDDMSEQHVKELVERKKQVMAAKGDAYPAWVLDRLGIETMLANRVALGRGLTAPRFRWVPFVDALMFPLRNERLKSEDPDRKVFYRSEERVLHQYLDMVNGGTLPPTLAQYVELVVKPVLRRQRKEGAVAVKFEAAYLRALDFAAGDQRSADQIYARYAKASTGEPSAAEYKLLQDYVFETIALEAGELGLPVHIHSSGGFGNYFRLGRVDPSQLDAMLSSPALHKVTFVLLHGGWPYTKEIGFLLGKPNVYADFSAMTFLLYPHELASALRSWLEYMPERVLFGTDAGPLMPQINWEESAWMSVATARQALALALEGMVADGEITRGRAVEIARLVMRENARQLYKLP
jgi:predicted TIM-barrel fold metal-dependent hydrolase